MFRRRRIVKQMSAEELKTKLYEHFDKSGSLNKMRTELRGKLVSDLFKIAVPMENPSEESTTADFDKALLPLQVCNWLIYDHLQRIGYQYSLSTFVSEASLSHPEQLLTACDILSLFGLDNNTPEYKAISKMYSNKDKHQHLHSLLLAVIKCLFDSSYKSSEDFKVKEQLQNVSEEAMTDGENRTLYSDLRGDGKAENFSLRETSLSEQLQFVREEREKEIQSMRDKLLKEIDHLHEQERKLQISTEQERNEVKKKCDVLSKETEKLKEKEILLSKEYENKLERKVREMETDFISKVHTKENELVECLRKLQEKEQRLSELEVHMSNQRSSGYATRKEFEEMRLLYKSIQEKYSTLLDENTSLLKKFESLSDYEVLKGDLDVKSGRVLNLQRELEDNRKRAEKERTAFTENVRNLESKLKTKETEALEAQRQLNLTRDTLHMEETVWNKERQKLEQETLSSRDMYKTLIQRLEEQKDDIQSLHQTIHILHYQLTEKDRNATRSEMLSSARTIPKTLDLTRSNTGIFQIGRQFINSPPKYKENSLKFIEEAKDRISRLQREADTLQDKCTFIYSSTPEFHSGLSPLKVTGASSKSHVSALSHSRTEMLNNHFENLIRNEMPTLDLSLPSHIKSQLANTFTKTYVPRTLNMSDRASKGVANITDLSKSEFLPQKQPEIELNQELFHNDATKCSQGTASFEKSHIPISTSDSTAKAFTDVPKPELLGYTSLVKGEIDNQSLLQNQDNVTVFISDVLPSDFPDPTDKSKGCLGSDTTPAKSLESASKQKTVSLIEKETQAGKNIPKVLEDAPLVDLDAVWKRKSSISIIPSVVSYLPFETETRATGDLSEAFKGIDLDSAWKQKASVPSQVESSFRTQTQETANEVNIEKDSSNVVRDDTNTQLEVQSQDTTEKLQLEISSRTSSAKLKRQDQLSSGKQESDVVPNVDEARPLMENIVVTSQKSKEDEDIYVKKSHDDSLSELSEVHLSCGSEQEQQKEDSDNW